MKRVSDGATPVIFYKEVAENLTMKELFFLLLVNKFHSSNTKIAYQFVRNWADWSGAMQLLVATSLAGF